MTAHLTLESDPTDVYLDTGCGVSLVDRTWLLAQLPEVQILKMVLPLSVRGIGSDRYKTSDFIINQIYLPGIKDGNKVLASVRRELYIVKGLRVYILVSNNIFSPEGISIDITRKEALVVSCGVTIKVNLK